MDAYVTVSVMPSDIDTYDSDQDQLMTSAEFAQMAGVTKVTIHRAVKAGRIKPLRTPGGHFRFRRADVEALLAAEASA